MGRLGASTVVLTNAAGGVNRELRRWNADGHPRPPQPDGQDADPGIERRFARPALSRSDRRLGPGAPVAVAGRGAEGRHRPRGRCLRRSARPFVRDAGRGAHAGDPRRGCSRHVDRDGGDRAALGRHPGLRSVAGHEPGCRASATTRCHTRRCCAPPTRQARGSRACSAASWPASPRTPSLPRPLAGLVRSLPRPSAGLARSPSLPPASRPRPRGRCPCEDGWDSARPDCDPRRSSRGARTLERETRRRMGSR